MLGAPLQKVNHSFGGDLLKRAFEALEKNLDGQCPRFDLEKKGRLLYI